MKNKYKKSNSKPDKKAIAAQETKDILKRLAKPNKILAEKANNTGDLQNQPVENPDLINQPMEKTDSTEQDNAQATVATTPEIQEPEKKTDINLSDSGFFEPVIERAYAEQPQTQVVEPVKVEQPVKEPQRPKIVFAPKLTLTTDDTYKKVMGDGAYTDVSRSSDATENPQPANPTDSIPSMQFQEASFDLSDNADSLGRQIGQEAGNTTSEWAFGMLENFYPEAVAFFTKLPTDWIEKAKLPNSLEAEMLQKILAANNRNKNKVKISDFHKKNILPPLKRILEKKGWENVMPDELLLIIGLVVLAADSFFKIQEIKKENRVLEKQIKQKVQEYIDIRTEERKEIDSLKGELGEMRTFFANLKNAQAQQAAA